VAGFGAGPDLTSRAAAGILTIVNNLSDTSRFRRSEDFVARNIAGETVLVPIRQRLGDLESIYTLNEVATFIWERLAEPSTVGQLAAALDEAFDGRPAEVRRDVEEFLGQLLALQAVKPVAFPPDASDPTLPR
jgi:hypothetical protein